VSKGSFILSRMAGDAIGNLVARFLEISTQSIMPSQRLSI
jgi:hypothetical protein